MGNAVNGMRLDDFVPGCVENPVLQMHYAAVQALALAEEAPEQTPDVLWPDERTLNEKAHLLKAWKSAIDEAAPGTTPGALRTACKRADFLGADVVLGADPFAAARPAKAPRRDGPRAPVPLEHMREMVRSGDVERLSVPELRDWLKSQNVC